VSPPRPTWSTGNIDILVMSRCKSHNGTGGHSVRELYLCMRTIRHFTDVQSTSLGRSARSQQRSNASTASLVSLKSTSIPPWRQSCPPADLHRGCAAIQRQQWSWGAGTTNRSSGPWALCPIVDYLTAKKNSFSTNHHECFSHCALGKSPTRHHPSMSFRISLFRDDALEWVEYTPGNALP